MKLIDKKIESGGKSLPTSKHETKRATNVIDLAAVLQRSLQEAGKGKSAAKKPAKKSAARKKAA
jgi:non-homologous end joining protein Ku